MQEVAEGKAEIEEFVRSIQVYTDIYIYISKSIQIFTKRKKKIIGKKGKKYNENGKQIKEKSKR